MDSIIFGLQKFGGISNYWARLLDGFEPKFQADMQLLLPKLVRFSGFDPNWSNRYRTSLERVSPKISRWIPARCPTGTAVFHTSYYRVPNVRPRKYVVSAYDFMYERYRRGVAKFAHSTQKIISLQRSDVVACISQFTLNEVLEFVPNIDSQKLIVIPLGVDFNSYYPDSLSADAELELTVLFVGQRAGYKRFDLAIEAIRRASINFCLGIVGPPLNPTEILELNVKLGSRWRFFGSVSSSRLRELYSSVYALIFPSDCEGFGLPLLEAMACNCPVVAAGRASLPEVGGSAALYSDRQDPDEYTNALVSLGSPSLRMQHIYAGSRQAATFTWERTCALTQSLYLDG